MATTRPSKEKTTVVSVRMPRSLKERLHEMAHENRRSLNLQIVWALEQWVKSQEQATGDEPPER
jgi:predicted transcriptional regulator